MVQTKYLINIHNSWSVHHNLSSVITLIRFAKLPQLKQSDFIDTKTNAKYLEVKKSLNCIRIFKVMPSITYEKRF